MAVFKITCSHCGASMKTAKELPAGKKVRCAKCGEVFTVPAADDEDDAPKKKPAAKAKPAAKPAPAPPPAKKKADDDEDGGGIYGLIEEKPPPRPPKKKRDDDDDDEDDDEEEEDEAQKMRKKDLEFALDESIKDPRGPAQALVIMPSNLLIFNGMVSFLTSFFVIMFMLWPFLFSDFVVSADTTFKWAKSKVPIYKEYKDLTDDEKKQLAAAQWEWIVPMTESEAEYYFVWDRFGIPMRLTLVGVFAFEMILMGIVAYGGVQMQQLQSRGWAMASAIVALISVGLLIGVWCLIVLNNEKVIAGFNYKARY